MTPRLDRRMLELLDARMADWTARGRYGGIEWLIADPDGAPLHAGRAGAREIGGAPMPAAPIYRIYSMTKPIVSIAAMQLVEECRLRLHEPIARWLPEFARMQVRGPDGALRPAERQITVLHLLTHMAGLFYGFRGEPLEKEFAATGFLDAAVPLREAVRALAALPLDFEPGCGWRYSAATDVLGALLEEIEQEPLPDILRRRVLGPLGMAETGYFVPEAERGRIMGMHLGRDKETGAARVIDVSRAYPADRPDFARGGHGLFSTLEDYARFSGALLRLAMGRGPQPGLVGRRTLEYMTANHVPERFLPLRLEILDESAHPGLGGYGFGLGFRRALGPQGRRILAVEGEFGWSGAAETWFTVDPASGLHALVMAQNLDWPGASEDFQTMLTAALT
ncbi:serine hydrolase domain-containing protein [Oceanicella actignis]|uniref:CubicO group peptidase, beta-lactamase class C family n=1 Tax=Oceanicella actignis TaxID=1189325 RepID=A0A1M7S0J1_9RHOB|nr:serine hydrolase domain-containing protein [Oceanicella actignis]SES93391.1 CubicO group peptidase, beta-lactamase class C family [Oceanicella actignis]SHN52001.1 CubicO group peptidase, beta-lactamase class C family [Oceanicella actignis]